MPNNLLLAASDSGGISSWDYKILLPQLLTLVITTFIIMLLCIAYYKRLQKLGPSDVPGGLVLFAEIAIKWMERQVIDLMGMKYKVLTVYMMYLLLYIGIGNLLSIVGFESQITAYTVPLSLGLVTFFGIYYFGLKYQKLMYFKKFLFNPLELLTQFVPLISISFRLFGNILGGSIVILLLTSFFAFIWGHIPYIGSVDLLAGIILPFLSMYFDLFDGLIQSYIFAILTIAYWSMEINHAGGKDEKKRIVKVLKDQPTTDVETNATDALVNEQQTQVNVQM